MLVRPYRSTDEDSVIRIFRETAAPELRDAGDPALDYASHIWCRPYLMLDAKYCFVLDDGNGIAAGYIIGTPDTKSFVYRIREEYLPCIATKDDLRKPSAEDQVDWNKNLPNALRFILHDPEHMLRVHEPELLKQYPAHFHIDILPGFQRQGMGRQLFDVFCTTLSNVGVSGLHLVMAGNNIEAGKFYERIGVLPYPGVLDGGASGEKGKEQNGNVWRIRKL